MKFKNLLMVAVILAASSSVMLADLQVSSIPVTTIRADGQQELVGTVRFTVLAPASGNTGTISIDYGFPVSGNSLIGVTATGAFMAPVGNVIVAGSVVTVLVTAGGNIGDSITVSGVRVDATGGVTALDVSVSSTQIPIVAGQTVARVVNGSGMSKTVTSVSSAVILTDATVITASGNIVITEGFPSAWGNVLQEGPAATQSYQVRLSVNGLPTGVNLALTVAASTNTLAPVTLSVATLTSTANVSVISIGNSSASATESITINYAFVNAGPTLPLSAGTFNITATAFPQAGGGVPSFANDEMGDLAALTIVGGTTSLLFEYAAVSGAAGVDTGLAIANTSADALAFTVGNAVPVDGAITLHMYPNDGTAPFSYTTTAGSPGSGLDANGQVVAGSTYVVLISELLAAAGAGDFSGYIIAVCNFTHGHGIVFAGDFVSFVQTIQGHVILDPSVGANSRALLVAAGGESLGQ